MAELGVEALEAVAEEVRGRARQRVHRRHDLIDAALDYPTGDLEALGAGEARSAVDGGFVLVGAAVSTPWPARGLVPR